MRGLSLQFVQTTELRHIHGPRKLQNRELRMSGFRGNCETATKPRNLLQNCRNAEKLRISADICRNLLYFRDCRTADSAISSETVKPQNCRIIRISRNHISRRNCAVAQLRNRRTAELQLCFADGRRWLQRLLLHKVTRALWFKVPVPILTGRHY